MMERGLLRRLQDLCLNATVRWSAVHLLCSVLKHESPLHRHLILRKRYHFMDAILLELSGNSMITQSEIGNETAVCL
jgi:acetone carboxylase gamma subunit